jgi:hypothetical protein
MLSINWTILTFPRKSKHLKNSDTLSWTFKKSTVDRFWSGLDLAATSGLKIVNSLRSPHINQWAAAKASRTRRTVTPRAWTKQRVVFRDILTGDESWLLQHYNPRQIWCLSADEVQTKAAHAIAATKVMLVLFRTIHGAIFIDWPPLGEKFNRGYFCAKILELLSQALHSGRGTGFPRLIQCTLTVSHLIGYPPVKIVSRVANPDTFPNLPMAHISLPVTFSIRWTEHEIQRWRIREPRRAARED